MPGLAPNSPPRPKGRVTLIRAAQRVGDNGWRCCIVPCPVVSPKQSRGSLLGRAPAETERAETTLMTVVIPPSGSSPETVYPHDELTPMTQLELAISR